MKRKTEKEQKIKVTTEILDFQKEDRQEHQLHMIKSLLKSDLKR